MKKLSIKENKKRQFWWDFKKYRQRASWFVKTFEECWKRIRDFRVGIGQGLPTLILFFIPLITAISFIFIVTLAAGILYMMIAIFTLVIWFVWMLLIDMLHMPVIVTYRLWQYCGRAIFKKNYYICDKCHMDIWKTSWKIPLYGCPSCKWIHPWLWPNTYGIFYHQCGNCHTKIPTIFLLEKAKLTCYCPTCPKDEKAIDSGHIVRIPPEIHIKKFGTLPQLSIGIISPTGLEGTQFMITAMNRLQSEAKQNGFQIDLENKTREQDLDKSPGIFKVGNSAPIEYGASGTMAFVWRVLSRKDDCFMYLYTPTNNIFEMKENLEFLKYIHGLILVIDPSNDQEVDTVLGSVIRFIENDRNKVARRFNIPLAVVMNSYQDIRKINESTPHWSLIVESSFMPVKYFSLDSSCIDPMLWLAHKHGRMKDISDTKKIN